MKTINRSLNWNVLFSGLQDTHCCVIQGVRQMTLTETGNDDGQT
jgi:hypothetical protein